MALPKHQTHSSQILTTLENKLSSFFSGSCDAGQSASNAITLQGLG